MSIVEFIPNTLGGLLALIGSSGALGVGFKSLLDFKKSYIRALQQRVSELEQKNDASESLCEAKLAVVRHEVKNANGCLDALLMILDMLADDVLPPRAKKAIEETKARRLVQEAAIATQQAAVQTAIIERAQNRVNAVEAAEEVRSGKIGSR